MSPRWRPCTAPVSSTAPHSRRRPALSGKDAYIAGGGNSAGQAALHLARYARRVTLVVRASSLEAGMSHYLVQAIEAAPNVEVRAGTEVVGGGGEGHLRATGSARPRHRRGRTGRRRRSLRDDRGAPHSDWLPADIARDTHGFLLTGQRPSGRLRLAAGAPSARARDQHAWRAGGRRRPTRLGQAGGLRRRRGRDRRYSSSTAIVDELMQRRPLDRACGPCRERLNRGRQTARARHRVERLRAATPRTPAARRALPPPPARRATRPRRRRSGLRRRAPARAWRCRSRRTAARR